MDIHLYTYEYIYTCIYIYICIHIYIYIYTQLINFETNSTIEAFVWKDLHSFQRDTIYVPVMDAVFLNETRIDARKKMGASLDFHPDSLRYVPHSRIPVTIQVGSVAKSETVKASTIFIKMVHPMSGEMKDSLFYSIGSLTDNHLRESWND